MISPLLFQVRLSLAHPNWLKYMSVSGTRAECEEGRGNLRGQRTAIQHKSSMEYGKHTSDLFKPAISFLMWAVTTMDLRRKTKAMHNLSLRDNLHSHAIPVIFQEISYDVRFIPKMVNIIIKRMDWFLYLKNLIKYEKINTTQGYGIQL